MTKDEIAIATKAAYEFDGGITLYAPAVSYRSLVAGHEYFLVSKNKYNGYVPYTWYLCPEIVNNSVWDYLCTKLRKHGILYTKRVKVISNEKDYFLYRDLSDGTRWRVDHTTVTDMVTDILPLKEA